MGKTVTILRFKYTCKKCGKKTSAAYRSDYDIKKHHDRICADCYGKGHRDDKYGVS